MPASSDGSVGSATIVQTAAPQVFMVTDGPCATATLDNLRIGVGSKPLPEESLARAKTQATAFLDLTLQAYASQVAQGEVGSGGTARASSAAPRAGRCPTGLLYGRVQSGKTLAMITFSALAIDNGFRVIVVLTTNYIKLIEQTAERFAALQGPLPLSSTSIDSWSADVAHVRREIGEHGLLVVCGKDPQHLTTLVEFLEDVGASDYPAIILDDEADQATPDTNTSARAAQRPTAKAYGSTINRRTIGNLAPGEQGLSLREKLRHNVFLQVTATPYALLLQNTDNPLRPHFAHLLEPAEGYTGGEAFFDEDHVLADAGNPPLVFVDENESTEIENGVAEAPIGLAKAIAFFMLSATAQFLQHPSVRGQAQNFLCHTSPKTTEHQRLADLIRAFVTTTLDELRSGQGASLVRLDWAYEELKRTLPEPPDFAAICNTLKARLPRRQIVLVNSAASRVDLAREMNFVVGGNILGRGLTIENLLVTYYLRRAKTSQMDTMLQHARMFGYRSPLMPYTRVFLPESLAIRFQHIHVAERSLRNLLADPDRRSRIPVQTTTGLRATRTNVLDTGSLSAFVPGSQVYPLAPPEDDPKAVDNFEELLKPVLGGAIVNPREFVEVSIGQLVELVLAVPFSDDDPGSWDPPALATVLKSIASEYGNVGYVYWRTMQRKKRHFSTGASEGREELPKAREKGRPVLLLFKDDSRKGSPYVYWYPTLVFPEDMPTHVYNIT